MKVVLAIPTFNAGCRWIDVVSAIKRQSYVPNSVVTVDSLSHDNTVAISRKAGFITKVIEQEKFNHGGTRQAILREYLDHDIIVFITQDALFKTNRSIEAIIKPFHDVHIAAVCGRQLPRINASAIESHARLRNYPCESFIRTYTDKVSYGLKTAFLSNSFAAYRISSLKRIGGFPDDVILGEDMYVAARMLLTGYNIAYAADACVYHSHDYTISQEFKRYFDMGVFHGREPWIINKFGKAEGEGFRFVISELRYLLRHSFWRIPEALLRTLSKYIAYRMGLMEVHIPLKIKKYLSMNPGYFN
jgi:rhamnosyltransferase